MNRQFCNIILYVHHLFSVVFVVASLQNVTDKTDKNGIQHCILSVNLLYLIQN